MITCDTCEIFNKNHIAGCSGRPGGLEITRRGLDICRLAREGRILDIACGRGETIEYLSAQTDLMITGTDISFSSLRNKTTLQPHLLVAQADGAHLPFKGEVFDAVLVECALSIMDVEHVLRECRRLLKPDAKLILNDVYIRNERASAGDCLSQTHCLTGLMTRARIFEHLTRHRFRVNTWEDQSQALKYWVAVNIFSFGSLERFYQHLAVPGVEMKGFKTAIEKLRLGYYLLIAEKAD